MLKLIRQKLGGAIYKHKARRALSTILHHTDKAQYDVTDPLEWGKSFNDPTDFYQECVRFFHSRLPAELRAHRAYFREGGRSFGEDAFHVLWYMLLRKFKPGNFLEIGVYRGQTLSLVALSARMLEFECKVTGLSPFTAAGDSVSAYRPDVDYFSDTSTNFAYFNLPAPELWRFYSTDTQAAELIASRVWDCVYIDGNHDYEVARHDWLLCSRNLAPGGLIVLDDAAKGTAYHAPVFATEGHPGPSRLATEIAQPPFREIVRVGHNRVFQKTA
jgi:hypothetical protein